MFTSNSIISFQCQKEIDDVIGSSRTPTMSDKDNLPFVSATLQEVMRLRPAVPTSIARQNNKESELGGYRIPKHSGEYRSYIAMSVIQSVIPMANEESFMDNDPFVTEFNSCTCLCQKGDNILTILPCFNNNNNDNNDDDDDDNTTTTTTE